MDNSQFDSKAPSGRRTLLKNELAAGAAGAGIAVLAGTSTVFAQSEGLEQDGGGRSKGDAALLRFPDGLTFSSLNAPPYWQADVADQPDRARVIPIPQPQAPHSPDRGARRCCGSCELLDSHGSPHWPVRRLLRTAAAILAEMQTRPDESATDLFARILWKGPGQRPCGFVFFL